MRFHEIAKRCKCIAFEKGNNYREEKEALIAAVFLFGLEKEFCGRHFLQNGEYIAHDIDIAAIEHVDQSEIQFRRSHNLQITEFESHNENLNDVLKSKQKAGYDGSSIDLIVNVRDKEGRVFEPEEIFRQCSILGLTYKSVWLEIEDIRERFSYHLIRIHPELLRIEVNIEEAFAAASAPDYVRILPKYGRYEFAEKEFYLRLQDCPVCGAKSTND